MPAAFFVDLFVGGLSILEEIELEEAFVNAIFPFYFSEIIFVLHLTEVHCGHKEFKVNFQMAGSLPLIKVYFSMECQLEAMPETLSVEEDGLPTLGRGAAFAFIFDLGGGELINKY